MCENVQQQGERQIIPVQSEQELINLLDEENIVLGERRTQAEHLALCKKLFKEIDEKESRLVRSATGEIYRDRLLNEIRI